MYTCLISKKHKFWFRKFIACRFLKPPVVQLWFWVGIVLKFLVCWGFWHPALKSQPAQQFSGSSFWPGANAIWFLFNWNTIFVFSFCPALNLSCRLYPLSCILFIFMALLTLGISDTPFDGIFSMMCTLQKYCKWAVPIQHNTFRKHAEIAWGPLVIRNG